MELVSVFLNGISRTGHVFPGTYEQHDVIRFKYEEMSGEIREYTGFVVSINGARVEVILEEASVDELVNRKWNFFRMRMSDVEVI